jgi:hypothetical protein
LHDDYAVTLALLAHQMKRGALHAPIICVLALDGSDEAARAERTEKDLRSREREERFFRRGFRLS